MGVAGAGVGRTHGAGAVGLHHHRRSGAARRRRPATRRQEGRLHLADARRGVVHAGRPIPSKVQYPGPFVGPAGVVTDDFKSCNWPAGWYRKAGSPGTAMSSPTTNPRAAGFSPPRFYVFGPDMRSRPGGFRQINEDEDPETGADLVTFTRGPGLPQVSAGVGGCPSSGTSRVALGRPTAPGDGRAWPTPSVSTTPNLDRVRRRPRLRDRPCRQRSRFSTRPTAPASRSSRRSSPANPLVHSQSPLASPVAALSATACAPRRPYTLGRQSDHNERGDIWTFIWE